MEKELETTGERFMKSFDGIISLEHWHRYYLVKNFVKNKSVLDLASGEGYGSHLLSSVALDVTGVDISNDAIAHSINTYKSENLKFKLGDCTNIPLDDKSVDVVVSFETIEHHDKHNEMLLEIKRVLRLDGILIISSPDKHEYSDIPNYSNPYHVKELYTKNFTDLISNYFLNIELADQRVVVGSLIVPRNNAIGFDSLISDSTELTGVDWNNGFKRAIYNIAFASDSEIPLIKTTLNEFSVEKAKEIIFSNILNMENIDSSLIRIKELENEVVTYKSLHLENSNLTNELANIKSSRTWRLISKSKKILNLIRYKNG